MIALFLILVVVLRNPHSDFYCTSLHSHQQYVSMEDTEFRDFPIHQLLPTAHFRLHWLVFVVAAVLELTVYPRLASNHGNPPASVS